MRKYPTKRLIKGTKVIALLYQFLRYEVGLRKDVSTKDMKVLLEALKTGKKRLI